MSYLSIGAGGPAEDMCSYGSSKLRFRGPQRSLERPFIACVGGTETFGRFVDDPFPSVLERRLDQRCINFGSPFCGLEALLDDHGLSDLLDKVELCIVQTPSLFGHSNRFYRVHTRRNDRFIAPTTDLATLYPEEDFTEIHFVGHLLRRLMAHSDARFEVVAQELRQAWVKGMRSFLERIKPPIVLLDLSVDESSPEATAATAVRDAPHNDVHILDTLRPLCAEVVMLRVQTAGESDDLEDLLFGTLQQPIAEHMIGPAAHRRIAEALVGAVSEHVA